MHSNKAQNANEYGNKIIRNRAQERKGKEKFGNENGLSDAVTVNDKIIR